VPEARGILGLPKLDGGGRDHLPDRGGDLPVGGGPSLVSRRPCPHPRSNSPARNPSANGSNGPVTLTRSDRSSMAILLSRHHTGNRKRGAYLGAAIDELAARC